MYLAARQLPDEPGLHRAEQQLSALRLLPRAGYVFEHPAYLRPGEVRVDDKTGLCAVDIRQSLGSEAVAVFCRAPVLPDYRVMYRLASRLVPYDGRLALVRYAYRRYILRRCADLRQRLGGNGVLR